LACETRTSPGFASDNDSGCFSFDTTSVWADLAIHAVPFSTGRAGRGPVHAGEPNMWSTLARTAEVSVGWSGWGPFNPCAVCDATRSAEALRSQT
jgi:hypothetical protein